MYGAVRMPRRGSRGGAWRARGAIGAHSRRQAQVGDGARLGSAQQRNRHHIQPMLSSTFIYKHTGYDLLCHLGGFFSHTRGSPACLFPAIHLWPGSLHVPAPSFSPSCRLYVTGGSGRELKCGERNGERQRGVFMANATVAKRRTRRRAWRAGDGWRARREGATSLLFGSFRPWQPTRSRCCVRILGEIICLYSWLLRSKPSTWLCCLTTPQICAASTRRGQSLWRRAYVTRRVCLLYHFLYNRCSPHSACYASWLLAGNLLCNGCRDEKASVFCLC